MSEQRIETAVPTAPKRSSLRTVIDDLEADSGPPEHTIDRWLSFVCDLTNADLALLVRMENGLPNEIDATKAKHGSQLLTLVDIDEVFAGLRATGSGVFEQDDQTYHGADVSARTEFSSDYFVLIRTITGTPFTQALVQERLALAIPLLKRTINRVEASYSPRSVLELEPLIAAASRSEATQYAADLARKQLEVSFASVLLVQNHRIVEARTAGREKPSAAFIGLLKTLASESLEAGTARAFKPGTVDTLAARQFLARMRGTITIVPSIETTSGRGCVLIASTDNQALVERLLQEISPVISAKLALSSWSRATKLLSDIPGLNSIPPKQRGLAAAASLMVLSLIPLPLTVKSPAALIPATSRIVTAPISARLDDAFVRPGDRVIGGETILAKFDIRDLEAERDALASKKAAHLAAHAKARAAGDPAEARVAFLQAEEAGAELDHVQLKISQAKMHAPISGIVLDTTLHQELGEAKSMGDTLLTIAANEDVDLVIHFDADYAAHLANIAPGGTLQLDASPGQKLSFDVDSIYPIAEVIDGQNRIRINGSLKTSQIKDEHLIPGMSGTAKLSAGWRPAIWHFLHEPIRRVRLYLGL